MLQVATLETFVFPLYASIVVVSGTCKRTLKWGLGTVRLQECGVFNCDRTQGTCGPKASVPISISFKPREVSVYHKRVVVLVKVLACHLDLTAFNKTHNSVIVFEKQTH